MEPTAIDTDQFDKQAPLLASKPASIFSDLCKFRVSLRWCALDHTSWIGRALSYFVFILLTLIVPLLCALFVRVPSTASSGIAFDKLAQLPESALAAIAFFTLSSFFHRYGLQHLLFVDGLHDDSPFVRSGYAKELDRTFRYLTYIILPSFALELAHKIIFFSMVSVSLPYVKVRLPWNSIMFVAVLASRVYRTGVFLLVCLLFRLTCELQILRLEGFRNLMGSDSGSESGSESESHPAVLFREHVRIKKQLLATSHRYRIFIIGCLVTITISQFGALLLVLASKYEKNFFNSGDLMVCAAVQLSGFFMCLMGATRITHRAQRMAAMATKWHMIMTCNSTSDTFHVKVEHPPVTTATAVGYCTIDDSDALISLPTQDSASPFQRRQALVMYLQHNNGGITLFGFALDRGLLHTLFAFEFSLVLWILSKVVVLS